MTKPAADSTTTDPAKVKKLKRVFLFRLAEMTTKLAVAFLVPALIGIYADKQMDSQYTWSLAGIFIGILCGTLVMIRVIKEVDKEMGV